MALASQLRADPSSADSLIRAPFYRQENVSNSLAPAGAKEAAGVPTGGCADLPPANVLHPFGMIPQPGGLSELSRGQVRADPGNGPQSCVPRTPAGCWKP